MGTIAVDQMRRRRMKRRRGGCGASGRHPAPAWQQPRERRRCGAAAGRQRRGMHTHLPCSTALPGSL